MALCVGSGIWEGAKYPWVYVWIHMCESLLMFLVCKQKQRTRLTMPCVSCDVLQDYNELSLNPSTNSIIVTGKSRKNDIL